MKEEETNAGAGDFSGLGDLSDFFAPSWAKDEAVEAVRIVEGRPGRHDREDRDDGERRRDGGPRPRRDGGERPRRDDGRPAGRRDGAPRDGAPRDRDFQQGRGGPRPRRDDGRPGARQMRPPAPAPEPMPPLSVRFLPDGRALDAIIRRIQTTRRAYPFRDIVKLFRSDDASLALRIEADRAADPAARVFQCKACSLPALSADELSAHLVERHLGDFFEAREVEVDAPSGNFPCVARCGLTGELLGPPNHHTFAARIQQMLRERFPQMSEQEYRSRIEMVRDPETIEQWRESARHQTLYFRREEKPAAAPQAPEAGAGAQDGVAADAPQGEPAPAAEEVPEKGISRQEAEAVFRRDVLPSLVHSATHVVCPAKSLKNMANRRLAHFLSREFAHDEEMRSQGSLARAIHAAFHHRGLKFFRTIDDRGQEFVSAVAPAKLDTANVTEEIRLIVSHVEANPCCQAKALVAALAPDGDDEATKRLVASLRWLVEKGHIVEYFNGALVVAASHPFFSQKPPKAAPAPGAVPPPPPAGGNPAASGVVPPPPPAGGNPAASKAAGSTGDAGKEAPAAAEEPAPAPEAPATEEKAE